MYPLVEGRQKCNPILRICETGCYGHWNGEKVRLGTPRAFGNDDLGGRSASEPIDRAAMRRVHIDPWDGRGDSVARRRGENARECPRDKTHLQAATIDLQTTKAEGRPVSTLEHLHL